MNPESHHPFRGELEPITGKEDFDLHSLKTPTETVSITEGEEREFRNPKYAITEYFSSDDKNHEGFVKLKKFYEAAQKELGDYLPESYFVEGEPSNGTKGKSFYVIQKFESSEFNPTAKGLEELNSKEFSTDFLNQLLTIQEKINKFLEEHATELPADWIDEKALDPKMFKEDVIHSPDTGQTRLTSFFKFSPDSAKRTIESEGKFEPTKDRLKLLKLLGLSNLVEKINWAIEKSAAPEWIKGSSVHWGLDKKKLEQEGKRGMALTFDDGPNEETEKLLDILKEKGVKATFFLVGSQILGRENIVKRIVEEGHDIGVHEWGQEGASPSAGLKEYSKRFVGPRHDLGDVKKTAELIEKVTGNKPALGRVAGVHGTVDSLREFQSMGLEIIHGNPYDVVAMPPSKTLKAESLLKKSLSSNGQGRIRIFHIGAMKDSGIPTVRPEINFEKGEVYPPEETLKMIGEFIDKSRSQGYEFVMVKEYI